jgi:hypothetical protein
LYFIELVYARDDGLEGEVLSKEKKFGRKRRF